MIENGKNYIPSSEIVSIVKDAGYSLSTFYRYVKAGKVEKLGSQKSASYKRGDVEAFLRGELTLDGRKKRLPRVHRLQSSQYASPDTLIDVVTKDDLAHVFLVETEQQGYDQALPPNIIWSWLEKNDHVYWLLSNPQNRKDIWATLGVLPLDEQLIFKLLKGELSPKDIKPNDILTYELGREYTCYVVSATSKGQDFLNQMMQHIFSYWHVSSPIRISKLYASSSRTTHEDSTLHLMKEFFFSELCVVKDQTLYDLNIKKIR